MTFHWLLEMSCPHTQPCLFIKTASSSWWRHRSQKVVCDLAVPWGLASFPARLCCLGCESFFIYMKHECCVLLACLRQIGLWREEWVRKWDNSLKWNKNYNVLHHSSFQEAARGAALGRDIFGTWVDPYVTLSSCINTSWSCSTKTKCFYPCVCPHKHCVSCWDTHGEILCENMIVITTWISACLYSVWISQLRILRDLIPQYRYLYLPRPLINRLNG